MKNHDNHFFKKAAEKLYGPHAHEYAEKDEAKWRNPSQKALLLKEICAANRPETVLELGVGTGRYFPYLSGSEYWGVDVCGPMLEQARRRAGILKDRGFLKQEFIETGIHEFLNAKHGLRFDFVFSIGCLGYHVPLDAGLFQSIRSVLRPGGHLYFQTTQASAGWKMKNEIRKMWGRLKGFRADEDFFCVTSEKQLKKNAESAGFSSKWILKEDTNWFGKPMLLSFFEKNG